ncbi:Rha family transcriptional regulator [Prevotella sp. P6B4]|uniref:Rha family transcriptional regulator n=1 Tax=Prevotella sp. P6B4 TaxID=1410614 RepID=UPI000A506EC5|nr:Rha family transcriptional regulator [Prevotella sp. P6B4]
MEQTSIMISMINNNGRRCQGNEQCHNPQHMMTSLEIAEVTGKLHTHVMRSIRNMEPAWVKVNGTKFGLVEYRDKKGELRPCYQLTKIETLYIATKFNDEARARLVLRWEQLEHERLDAAAQNSPAVQDTNLPALPPKKIIAMADEIVGHGLRLLNEEAEDTLTATQVAKTFNMTTIDFNAVLVDMGIQYRAHGRWNLAESLEGRGYTAMRTHVSYSLKGRKKIRHYMTWTIAGLHFLNAKLGYPNF